MNIFSRMLGALSPARTFRAQQGSRIYAIGDVHGRLDLLEELLAQIKGDIAERPSAANFVVLLGDLIDRGPASAQVIERLLNVADVPAKFSYIMGNHEEIFLRALSAEPGVAYDWLTFGGDACVESYGLNPATLNAMPEQAIADLLTETIPVRHIEFVRGFVDTVRSGDYLFVHAGIRPGVAIEEQLPHDLRWIRSSFLRDNKDHGVMVIHGHTITDEVDEHSNRIGIDTGAYRTGLLTALALEDDQRWTLSTGLRGQRTLQ
ncbi:metallophosphoesterase [Sphingomonas sp.]|jgi:serine/threonine protein phosphatase 1|uniref:metallophosphoesterase n=1 Tax=Sphingomonas sp. TaxID=28214 RepID=UPI002D7F4653|nr:metallophosphoesterase [Sphingomonas sp.]HEU0044548.1 metallophosphoesterase [Sphingomonas sp.]